ncbi:hypothetical protein JCM10212_005388 [Sporobolomyces blumeae]
MPSHTHALAALPRQLRLSPSTPISRTHLVALYKEHLRVANSFASYNFKQYFLRRSRDKFRAELPALLDEAYNPTPSSSSSSSASTSALSPTDARAPAPTTSTATREERLREWYQESLKELGVMARSAIVNGMYEAPKLVVEGRGNVMATGGGGAGAEASYGGGGQPANPEASS